MNHAQNSHALGSASSDVMYALHLRSVHCYAASGLVFLFGPCTVLSYYQFVISCPVTVFSGNSETSVNLAVNIHMSVHLKGQCGQ